MEMFAATEFGDWILNELLAEEVRATSNDALLREASKLKIQKLEVAKELLLEFQSVQDEMMQRAARLRQNGKAILNRCTFVVAVIGNFSLVAGLGQVQSSNN